MSAARIVLVDDHQLVRAGLRALMDGFADMLVVGECGDAAAALELVRRDPPEIVVTDIAMKGAGGLQLAADLKREFPLVRVVVLSMHAEKDYVDEAFRVGAAAYLLKDAATAELELALRSVLSGASYLSPAVAKTVVEGYIRSSDPSLASLTPRQREILQLIATGASAKQIAFSLSLSTKTVESHRAQIMERLQIRDTAGLVKLAIRTGLASLE
jgi:DNA-binding NarL/FixJ family response regulator